jgi:branched-chain amino acid transport system permease protein
MVFLSFLVEGIAGGCLYALFACGLVITYTTSGIFNFAHGAIGMFLAFFYWQLAVGWGWPWPIALLFTLFVAAPLLGALIERVVVRPLYGASLSVSLVVTLGLLLGLLGLADWFWNAQVTRFLPVFGSNTFHLFGVAVSYFNLIVLVVSVAVAVGWVLFRSTRLGLTMRAVVDDRDLTARAGASPYRTAMFSWAIGASIAGLAAILIAPNEQFDQFSLTFLVVVAYAAALIGKLKSLPLTVLGAMILGIAQSLAVGYLPVTLLTNLNPVIPTIVLFVALLFIPQDRLSTAKAATRKVRRTMRMAPSAGLGGGFVILSVLLATTLSAGNLIIFGQGISMGLVMLSLVLLSGYGGQVSLCQMTLAGFGAFFMGRTFGGNSILGLILSVLGPAVVGAILALVVGRLKGLYLALATLAFAEAADNIIFNNILGYGGELKVGRFLFSSQTAFTIEAAVVFALVLVGILALKRGSFGRRLAALNDSEAACASVGMSVTWTKVAVFTVAAGIAGLGGAFYGGVQGIVSPTDFASLTSLVMLLTITLAGIDTAAAAAPAAMFTALQPQMVKLLHIPNAAFILVGLGAISLGRNPGGLTGQLNDGIEILRGLRGRIDERARAARRPRLDSPFLLVGEAGGAPLSAPVEDSYAG